MLLRLPRAAFLLLAVSTVACGGEPSGAAPAGSGAVPTGAGSTPRPPPSVAAAGQPCGLDVGRTCGGTLTCVRPEGGEPTCQPLPRGVVCGAFQCAADDACCDRSRSECTKPGMECVQRPPVTQPD